MHIKTIFTFIFLLSLGLATAIEISYCNSGESDGVCYLGQTCACYLSDSCNNGNLIVYNKSVLNPLCLPKIVDDKAEINWEACLNPKDIVSVRAICEGKQSEDYLITLEESGEPGTQPSCLFNSETNSCYDNPFPSAPDCPEGSTCSLSQYGECICQYSSETIVATTGTTELMRTTTTKKALSPCPYECCDNEPGYANLECEEGLMCCPNEEKGINECKKSCFEEKSGGSKIWIVLLIILLLGGVVAVLYFTKIIHF